MNDGIDDEDDKVINTNEEMIARHETPTIQKKEMDNAVVDVHNEDEDGNPTTTSSTRHA